MMHRMYTLRQKQKVADYARMHGVRPAAAHFGIVRKKESKRTKTKAHLPKRNR